MTFTILKVVYNRHNEVVFPMVRESWIRVLAISFCSICVIAVVFGQPSDSLVWQMVVKNELNYKCSGDIDSSDNLDRAAFQYCMIGESTLSQKTYESGYDKVMITDVDRFLVRNGASAIKSYLAEHKPSIVALNEAHHISNHRLVATTMLRELYEYGIRDIAIEGLDAVDTEINDRGFPKYLISGSYLRDPEYSNFVRIALNLGFRIHAYDQIREGTNREYKSAENLCNYMSDKGITKLFIYCGFDHVKENGSSVVSILSHFKNTNPFTISQTEHQGEPFRYDVLLCESTYTLYYRNSITYKKNGEGLKYYRGEQSNVDLCLFIREDYLNRKNIGAVMRDYSRVDLPIPLKRIKSEYFPFLIKVYNKSYLGELAIPIDVIQINSYSDEENYFVNLLKQYKNYTVHYTDCYDNIFEKRTIELN